MIAIKNMCKRNMLMFFRRKANIILAVSMALIPASFLLLLGGVWQIPMIEYYVGGIENAWSILRVNAFAVTLFMVALIVPFTVMSIMSEDYDSKALSNFLTSPLKRSQISLSYILSSILVGMLLIIITMIVGQILLLICGDGFIGISIVIELFSLSLFVITSLSSVYFYIQSFIKTTSASKGANGLFSGISPQLAGIYFPLIMLPATIVSVIHFLPISHAARLYREVLLLPTLKKYIDIAALAEISESFGIKIYMFENNLSMVSSLLVLLIYLLVFGFLSLKRLKKQSQK